VENFRNQEDKNVANRIYKKMPYLNPALKRIADYILKNTSTVKTMTIKDLALECKVAESTVTRFVREMGYSSYQELKITLAETTSMSETQSMTGDENYVYEDILRSDTTEVILDKILFRNIQTLNETVKRIDLAKLEKAANMISKSNVIAFACIGSSSVAAEEAIMRFTRAGKKCLLFRDASIQSMISSIIKEPDVMIAISNSGRTDSVVQALNLAKANGASTIAITSFEDSPLAKNADICLFTSTKTEPLGSGLYWESTTSKSAQILIIDALYACFAARNYEETLKNLEDTYKAIRNTRQSINN
jgi:DNA-binding MurR/RpiR family transcriptional regulator